MDRNKEIIKLYTEGISATEISKIIGIGRRTIYRILEQNKIPLHKNNEKVLKSCLVCDKPTNKLLCGVCQTNKRRYITKLKAIEYLGGVCNKCGWSGDPSGFDFHHTNPTEKDFNPTAGTLTSISWELAKKELDKCELLCALCHRLEHSNYDKFKDLFN